jgi:tocopherol cyclase
MFSLKRIFQPEIFQGRHQRKDYFEGWYFKQVTADQQTSIAFIPGISLNPKDPHAFIQMIFTKNKPRNSTNEEITTPQLETTYHRFPLADFTYKDEPFNVQIGKNRFSKREVLLDLHQDGLDIKGKISLSNLEPITKTLVCPNIMGVFGYLTFMECYHGIVSMGHTCSGEITLNGNTIDFSGGKGYIEKDWGCSFPKTYNWVQCNHFSRPDTSLFLSVAHIPFLGTSFKGFICNVKIEGKEYRFATYNRAKILHEMVNDQQLRFTLQRKNLILSIDADIMDQGVLVAPKHGFMDHTIKEGLSGEVRIQLTNHLGELLYEDTGSSAGVEIVKEIL